jgi:hypothetical protein
MSKLTFSRTIFYALVESKSMPALVEYLRLFDPSTVNVLDYYDSQRDNLLLNYPVMKLLIDFSIGTTGGRLQSSICEGSNIDVIRYMIKRNINLEVLYNNDDRLVHMMTYRSICDPEAFKVFCMESNVDLNAYNVYGIGVLECLFKQSDVPNSELIEWLCFHPRYKIRWNSWYELNSKIIMPKIKTKALADKLIQTDRNFIKVIPPEFLVGWIDLNPNTPNTPNTEPKHAYLIPDETLYASPYENILIQPVLKLLESSNTVPDSVSPVPDSVSPVPDPVSSVPDPVSPVPDSVSSVPDPVSPVPVLAHHSYLMILNSSKSNDNHKILRVTSV